MHIASRRRHARLATVAAKPAGISFSFFSFFFSFPSLFSLFFFSFLLSLFPSLFFLLLPPALCSRMPLPCAMRCAAAHPCAMPTRRGMLGAPLGLCPSHPVACTAAAINAGRVLHHGSCRPAERRSRGRSVRRSSSTVHRRDFSPVRSAFAPYKSS